MKTGHTPSRSAPEYWDDCVIPWFTLADVWQIRDGTRMYLGETANRISELGLANSSAELLPARTVVLSRTASVGFAGIMPEPMATSQDFWNWICGPALLPEYLVYVLRSMGDELKAAMIGSTHKTIYQAVAAAIRVPLPPLDEQRRIAMFLDVETARIDRLVARQEALIETLLERRAALIARTTQVLRRGWATNALRRIARMTTGSTPAGDPNHTFVADGEVGWVTPEDLAPNTRPTRWLSPSGENQVRVLESGTLLVCCIGATLGKVGLANERVSTNQQITALVIDGEPRYWYYALLSAQVQIVSLSVGNTMPIINNARLGSLRVAYPPFDEQREIADYLDAQTAKIDTLIAKAERFIALAKERRAALITAAVTGQIDVREAAA